MRELEDCDPSQVKIKICSPEDEALHNALGCSPTRCPTCGDEKMTYGVVNQPNLVCNRYIVWRCGLGHKGMVSIIDD